MKTFYLMYNIGKAKYTINYHDGVKTHKDGSPFFGIYIFKNKVKFNSKIKELKADGYIEIGEKRIYCDDCQKEINGLYIDNKDGSYTCISCDLKRQDGEDIDNCMGCDW